MHKIYMLRTKQIPEIIPCLTNLEQSHETSVFLTDLFEMIFFVFLLHFSKLVCYIFISSPAWFMYVLNMRYSLLKQWYLQCSWKLLRKVCCISKSSGKKIFILKQYKSHRPPSNTTNEGYTIFKPIPTTIKQNKRLLPGYWTNTNNRQTLQWPREKEKKDKERSAKHYTEIWRSNNTNHTKNRGWTRVLRPGGQFMLHVWNQPCYSYHKPGDKSWMRKRSDCYYDKQNLLVVICQTETP